MDEIEVPLEKVHEDMHHVAHQGSAESWMPYGALCAAILAVLAAISASRAGHHANEAMLEQIRASDRWNYYQAKGIKASVLDTKLLVISKTAGAADTAEIQKKLEQYKHEQEEIQAEAKELEESSGKHMKSHETFATSVTFFQIAIALTAIAVLVRRKKFLWVSIGFGVVGAFFLVTAIFS